MIHPDQLERFIFENTAVRGNLVRLNTTWLSIVERHNYPPILRNLIGELLAASALLAATLKFKGSLILQIQGKGAISLLVVECTSDLGLRATAKWDENISSNITLSELMGGGTCVITLVPEDGGQSYQGIVPLEGENVAQIITNYMLRSEQLETAIWLAVGSDCATGMLLQKMPEQPMHDADDWNRLVQLASTVKAEEMSSLDAKTLLYRLFSEDDIRLFEPQPVRFQCTCSSQNVASALRMLGKDDMMALLSERGKVEVNCEFCNQRYEFDQIDIEQIFGGEVIAPGNETRH